MPFICFSIFYKRGADGKLFEAIGKVNYTRNYHEKIFLRETMYTFCNQTIQLKYIDIIFFFFFFFFFIFNLVASQNEELVK
jgi:hypothetical protein